MSAESRRFWAAAALASEVSGSIAKNELVVSVAIRERKNLVSSGTLIALLDKALARLARSEKGEIAAIIQPPVAP